MVSVLRLADEHGVQVVDVVHPGLPVPNPPKANFDNVLDLPPGAFAITLFILSDAFGVGFSLSGKYGYDIDANQELIALGVSNVAAACLGGLVSGSSVSSTAANDRAGAKTQVSSLGAAAMVLITLVAQMPLFHNLPQAILSVIVIHAVARMTRVAELKRFYRFHPSEFGLALVALRGVITVGILPGLGIAVVLSLLRFIWGASHLSLSRLGPLPGREHSYQVIGDASALDSISGLEILRLDGSLFFANALHFRNEGGRGRPDRPTRGSRCHATARAAPCCRRHWPASRPPRG
jgi:sulfate permease, SulP family